MELGLFVRSSSEPDPRSGALLGEEPVFPCGNALEPTSRSGMLLVENKVCEWWWVVEFR